jgi:hypothetical protein
VVVGSSSERVVHERQAKLAACLQVSAVEQAGKFKDFNLEAKARIKLRLSERRQSRPDVLNKTVEARFWSGFPGSKPSNL